MLSSVRKTSGSARRRFSAVRACALFILIPPIRGGDVAYRRHLGRVLVTPVLEDGKGGRGKVHPLDAGLHEQADQVGGVDVPPQLAALPGHILLHRRVYGGLDLRRTDRGVAGDVVGEGDVVTPDTLLLSVDLESVRSKVPSLVTPVVFTNLNEKVIDLKKTGSVTHGEADILEIK